MEGNNKLEMSVQPSGGTPPASYKPIPETDMEDEATKRPKSLVKSSVNSSEVDGADEKMLSNENESSKISLSDVKIQPANEKQNGDAKLDVGEMKSAFIGMTKEELMKYANDPFWVRLRWFLFVTFWLLWAAMLFGAFMIIYAAPKCNPPPPRTWWQQGPLSQIEADLNVDLKSIKEKGIQGIVVNWPDDSYIEFDNTNNFMKFLQKSKDDSMNLIVELDPSSSLVWFNKSEDKDLLFDDYYIWQKPKNKYVDNENNPEPPNNWVNIYNESSWTYSNKRKEYYYSPNGKPHLNFRNPNVTSEFSNIIEKFINYGVNGISLKNIQYLLVDPKFEDEGRNNEPEFYPNNYGSYIHSKTENLFELNDLLLKPWRKIVKQQINDGPFMASDELTNIDVYKINRTLIFDLPLQSRLFTKSNLNAINIARGLNSTFYVKEIDWPLWKYNTSGVLDIITFLLPGTPIIKEDAPINSELLKIRNMPSIMRGNFNYYLVNNQTVFVFVRVTSGNPGIIVAYNPTDSRIIVNFPMEIPTISEEVTVQLFSSNYNETEVAVNVKQNSDAVPISPKSAIVLSYVPKVPA